MAIFFDEVVARVQAEFRGVPGLSVTIPQASQFWQIDPLTCEAVFRQLVKDGFLTRTEDGRFFATRTPDAIGSPDPSRDPSPLA